MLRKSPGFAVVAVLAMSLGIGANTWMFTFVNAYLLRALPLPEPERLILLGQQKKGVGTGADYATWQYWRAQSRTFSSIAAYQFAMLSLTGDGEPERFRGAKVSADYFRVLGVRPAAGRDFLDEEDAAGGPRAVILGYNLWQTRFGGAPGVVGRGILVDGERHTVVGILPRGIHFPPDTQLYTPLAIDPAGAPRGRRFLRPVGRLKPGVAMAQARAELNTFAAQLARQYPDTNAGWSVSFLDMREAVVRGPKPSMYILSTAVAFVLLIACANVANLLLARAAARTKEIAIRISLGATRLRIVRQMLTESVVVAFAGGAIGLLVSDWGAKATLATLPSYMLPLVEVRTDATVLGFTLVLSVLTGILFGLAPALQISGTSDTLKEAGRGLSGGRARGRLRSTLVVTELALSLILLIGAALLIKSFAKLQFADLGFRIDGLMTMHIALPENRYKTPEQRSGFFGELLERVGHMPGVEAAGATSNLPISGGGSFSDFLVEGRPAPARDEVVYASVRSVSPEYFRAMGLAVRTGRAFSERDAAANMPVAIVNETFVRRMLPPGNPLGKRVRVGLDLKSPAPWLTIVGVCADVRHFGIQAAPFPEIYQSYLQSPPQGMSYAVRAGSAAPALAASLRALVRSMDADQPVADLRSMESLLADQVAVSRTLTRFLSLFAGLALLLAVMGIYGVISYSVVQRTHEIGIRMALGAGRNDMVRMVVQQALKMAALAIVIGLACAFAVTRLLSTVLYGVGPRDALIFTAVPVIVALVTLAASWLPARRAARVQPLIALRYE